MTAPSGDKRLEFHRAQDAEERGEGICRTCLAPIWNEGGTVGRRRRAEGWSDRIERGGDSLVCFKARDYRHVPLAGREAAIYDHAFARAAVPLDDLRHRKDNAVSDAEDRLFLRPNGATPAPGIVRRNHPMTADDPRPAGEAKCPVNRTVYGRPCDGPGTYYCDSEVWGSACRRYFEDRPADVTGGQR